MLQGGWVSAHTYGWTQFDIDADTQALTVTIYGIPGYGPDDAGRVDDEPMIVSQFVVNAQPLEEPALQAMVSPMEGYGVEVALTIGETIEGTTGTFNATTAGAYTPVGVLDGLGAWRVDLDGDGNPDVVRVFANHELQQSAGNAYEVSDGTGGTFTLTGARISYFDFDIETRQIVDGGLAYDTIIDANGEIATDNTFLPIAYAPVFGGPETASQWQGFSRFCSSVLVEAEQFGKNRGLVDTIYFAGEEDRTGFNSVGGAEWALDVETGTLHQIPAMGRGGWENVTQIDTGDRKHVAFILADDNAPFDFDGDGVEEAAPLFLYVGEKDRRSDDFLALNGLADGKLYAWVAEPAELSLEDKVGRIQDHLDDARAEGGLRLSEKIRLDILERLLDRVDENEKIVERIADRLDVDLTGDAIDSPAEFNGTGQSTEGRWVEIDNAPRTELASEDGTTGYDEYGYPTQSNLWLQAADLGAFGFSRPEDVATNPSNGAEFVLASTGVDTYDIDPETGNGVDTFGTLYTMEIDFRNGVPKGAELKILYDGDDDLARALRSPDNLDWTDDGLIYVQEDKAETDTASGDEFLFGDSAVNTNEAGIVQIGPGTGTVVRIANIDRSAVLDGSLADPTLAIDTDAGVAGEWETSGILDVSDLFGGNGGEVFLVSVQAHGIADQDAFNSESRITDGDLVEGGQFVLLTADAFILA